jgi:hypothetical protein
LKTHKLFLLLLLFISATSCNQGTSDQRQTDSSVKQQQEKTLDETSIDQEVRSLSNQNDPFLNTIYSFTTDFNMDSCQLLRRCDCCVFETFFLENSRFEIIDFCEGARTYMTGIYKLLDDKIEIRLDSSYLTIESSIEFVNDTLLSESVDTTVYIRVFEPSTITIDTCQSQILLQSGEQDPYYGIQIVKPLSTFEPELYNLMSND